MEGCRAGGLHSIARAFGYTHLCVSFPWAVPACLGKYVLAPLRLGSLSLRVAEWGPKPIFLQHRHLLPMWPVIRTRPVLAAAPNHQPQPPVGEGPGPPR